MNGEAAAEAHTSPLVEALARFNRKERFHLLQRAVGHKFGTLCESFRQEIGDSLDLNVPPSAWWTFDYHIDWLFGAFLILEHPEMDVDELTSQTNPHPGHAIGTNEDFDLIIAFESTLILVEAKTGAWVNSQMKSKMERLISAPSDKIAFHLILTSPKEPKKLSCDGWPTWALRAGKPIWLKLPFLEDAREPLMVSRCDAAGKAMRTGERWGVYRA